VRISRVRQAGLPGCAHDRFLLWREEDAGRSSRRRSLQDEEDAKEAEKDKEKFEAIKAKVLAPLRCARPLPLAPLLHCLLFPRVLSGLEGSHRLVLRVVGDALVSCRDRHL